MGIFEKTIADADTAIIELIEDLTAQYKRCAVEDEAEIIRRIAELRASLSPQKIVNNHYGPQS